MIEGSCAMLKQRRGFFRDRRHEECVVLLRLQGTPFEKRDPLVEHGRVARCIDVLHGAIGQPHHIIADARANPLTGRAGDRG